MLRRPDKQHRRHDCKQHRRNRRVPAVELRTHRCGTDCFPEQKVREQYPAYAEAQC